MEIHLPKQKEIIMSIIGMGTRERNRFVKSLTSDAGRSTR